MNNSDDITTLEKWIDSFGFKPIREHDVVQRLKRIRFLGTMHYTLQLKYFYSRYDHSLNVARLADCIGGQLGVSRKTRKTLVLMSLLHDIGHLPFSHASEVFFRQRWGRYHTGHGSRIARHLIKSLLLKGNINLAEAVKEANEYLAGSEKLNSHSDRAAIYEIFHGELSADTLDGISRAAKSIGLPYPDPLSICNGFNNEFGTVSCAESVLTLVYDFLNLKKKIYTDYVYSAQGCAAEAMLTRALELSFSDLTDKNEFIALDDDTAIERIKNNSYASGIYKCLESRQIYYSMRETALEKIKLINDVYNNLGNSKATPFEIKQALEKFLIDQLSFSDATQFIVHSSIRLNFPANTYYQENLSSLSKPLQEINREFNTFKTYGESIDIFFSPELLTQVEKLKIPTSLDSLSSFRHDQKLQTGNEGHIDKHLGSYMTPTKIAEFIADWAINNKSVRILDPSSGEGIFLRTAYSRLITLGAKPDKAINNVFGVESDKKAWHESFKNWPRKLTPSRNNIMLRDYFEYVSKYLATNKKPLYDVIMGNPPYISFHRFHGSARQIALETTAKIGVSLSQRTSSWAPYVICATALLKENGRLGLVLPAELLTTDYAGPVREYLLKRFKSCTFIMFKKCVFPTVQQDVVLLLASNDKPFGIKSIEVKDAESLSQDILEKDTALTYSGSWLGSKWTNLITDMSTLKLIDKLIVEQKVHLFDKIASVSIGQVTGSNSFYLLTQEKKKQLEIKNKWLVPIVANASAISGAIFHDTDFKALVNNDERCYLLRIPTTANILSDEKLQQYLEEGKRLGINQRYKCRKRWPWYSIPMQKLPDAFLTYMSGNYARLVLNKEKVYSTNTIHNIRFNENIDQDTMKAYIVAFYSSLTGYSIEVMGRAYGGGVLKLEIGEANKIILPNFDRISPAVIRELAAMLGKLDLAVRIGNIDGLIEKIDNLLLKKGLKLSDAMCKRISVERRRLVLRRTSRYT